MATNFVEHSAKIKQVAYLVVGTANTQVFHTGAHFCGSGMYCEFLTAIHQALQDFFSGKITYSLYQEPLWK
jgi:hypothetical protein